MGKNEFLLTGLNFYVPPVFTHEIAEETRLVQDYTGDERKEYTLNPIQRLFVLFEHPGSCQLGVLSAIAKGFIIFLNITVFIVGSCPSYQDTPVTCAAPACNNDPILCPGRMICQPIPRYSFQYIEMACVIYFTLHYLIPVLTCWSVTPRLAGLTTDSKTAMPVPLMVIRYIFKWENIVCICAVVPLYAFLVQFRSIMIYQNTGFVRLLWLPLLFKVMRPMKGASAVNEIFFKTMSNSGTALLFALFFISTGTVLFASIIFILEKGVFRVTAEYPMGMFYKIGDILGKNDDLSKFTSIPVAVYFTVVTTTSLGYGDIVPRTSGGLTVACLLSLMGLCVLALPIAVIGGNFANLYAAYESQKEIRLKIFSSENSGTEALSAVELASLHEKQCRLIAGASECISQRSTLQTEKFFRVTGLLSMIIERTGRIDLTNAMCTLGDFEFGSPTGLHRSQRPATMEQINKWNASKSPPFAISILKTLYSRKESIAVQRPTKSYVATYATIILSIPRSIIETLGADLSPSQTWMVPRVYVFKASSDMYFPERLYVLHWYQRLFILLQESNSCKLARIIHWINTAVILLGIGAIFVSSNANFRSTPATCYKPACRNDSILCPNSEICESQPIQLLQFTDTFVVAVFTADYGIRVLISGAVSSRLACLVPDGWDSEEVIAARRQRRAPRQDPPPLGWVCQTIRYCLGFYNLIDMLTILPFFITIGAPGTNFLFLQVFSLLRVLRLLKLTKRSRYTRLLVKSMVDSMPVLTAFAVFVGFGIVVLACLIYIVEHGTFKVTSANPDGAFMRPSILRRHQEISQFRSIPDALYFVVISTATVGYGDMYATTQMGRFLACMMAYVGIFTWTLPLAIIGYNFVMGHERLIEEERDRINQPVSEALTEANHLSDDVCSADILAEIISLLEGVTGDSTYISEVVEALVHDSPKLCSTACQLRHLLSPPGVWDWETSAVSG